jgi:hypothetical protein
MGGKKTGARQKPLLGSISYIVVDRREGRNETLAASQRSKVFACLEPTTSNFKMDGRDT